MLLHLETGQYHGINEVGCLIWNLIDGKRTRADLLAAIRSQINDPPSTIEADVDRFIDDLRQRDLLLG